MSLSENVIADQATVVAEKQLSLKLLVDRKSRRVLFAEAKKEVVDFIFSLLALSVGTVVKLLAADQGGMDQCGIEKVYESLEAMDAAYMQPNANKTLLLNTSTVSPFPHALLLLGDKAAPSATSRRYYGCENRHYSNCTDYVTDGSGAPCPSCKQQMTTEMTYVKPTTHKDGVGVGGEGGGLVKGVVTYMVMDDLAVTPMSTISSITLLNKFAVLDLNVLEERVVKIGLDQGLRLLKASLQSRTALTDVFLGKKAVDPET